MAADKQDKVLNFSSEREQSGACSSSAEREKNQGKNFLNVPTLRFPEFSGEWRRTTIGECCSPLEYGMNAPAKEYDGKNKYIRITDIDEETCTYKYDDVVSPNALLEEKYKVLDNDILFARTGASTGKAYLYDKKDGLMYYAGFLIRGNVKPDFNSKFVFLQTQTQKYKKWVDIMSIRSGQPGINSQEYSNFEFHLPPSKAEQDKISTLFTLLDERITSQIRIIEDLKQLRSAIRNRIFKKIQQEPEQIVQIKEILTYEQPTKYLVSNTEYVNDSSLIPVLTANKAFILGYTFEKQGVYDKGDCIILDDFTLDCKIVDFPFKVKSSAIKILRAKNRNMLRYAFEYLKYLDLETSEHKRHYIAEIEPIDISLPSQEKIEDIMHLFESLDMRIVNAEKTWSSYLSQKKFLLRELFV